VARIISRVILGFAALSLALYAQAFVRLRRRGRSDHAGWGRAGLYALGLAVALAAVLSPLDALAEDKLLSAHMLQHLLLGDVAPVLLVLGTRGPIALFLLPPPLLRAVASVGPVRALVSLLLRPRSSFAVWAVAIAAWHVPAAYDAALAHPAVHVLEHSCFVLGGLLLWTQIVDPARRERLSPGRRAAFAAAALLCGMVLSEVLLVTGPLYAHYLTVAHRPFGLSAATDQARAGLLMMAEQIATLGTAGALLVWAQAERVSALTQPRTPQQL
jgi:cytochrome c oxidase assembly factor CtaG